MCFPHLKQNQFFAFAYAPKFSDFPFKSQSNLFDIYLMQNIKVFFFFLTCNLSNTLCYPNVSRGIEKLTIKLPWTLSKVVLNLMSLSASEPKVIWLPLQIQPRAYIRYMVGLLNRRCPGFVLCNYPVGLVGGAVPTVTHWVSLLRR